MACVICLILRVTEVFMFHSLGQIWSRLYVIVLYSLNPLPYIFPNLDYTRNQSCLFSYLLSSYQTLFTHNVVIFSLSPHNLHVLFSVIIWSPLDSSYVVVLNRLYQFIHNSLSLLSSIQFSCTSVFFTTFGFTFLQFLVLYYSFC